MSTTVDGRLILWKGGDLKARLLLINLAESEYEHGNKRGACSLIHAEEYLKDRLAYELFPWPKQCVPRDWGRQMPAVKR